MKKTSILFNKRVILSIIFLLASCNENYHITQRESLEARSEFVAFFASSWPDGSYQVGLIGSREATFTDTVGNGEFEDVIHLQKPDGSIRTPCGVDGIIQLTIQAGSNQLVTEHEIGTTLSSGTVVNSTGSFIGHEAFVLSRFVGTALNGSVIEIPKKEIARELGLMGDSALGDRAYNWQISVTIKNDCTGLRSNNNDNLTSLPIKVDSCFAPTTINGIDGTGDWTYTFPDNTEVGITITSANFARFLPSSSLLRSSTLPSLIIFRSVPGAGAGRVTINIPVANNFSSYKIYPFLEMGGPTSLSNFSEPVPNFELNRTPCGAHALNSDVNANPTTNADGDLISASGTPGAASNPELIFNASSTTSFSWDMSRSSDDGGWVYITAEVNY